MKENSLLMTLIFGLALFALVAGVFVYVRNIGGLPQNEGAPANAVVEDDSQDNGEHRVLKPVIPSEEDSKADQEPTAGDADKELKPIDTSPSESNDSVDNPAEAKDSKQSESEKPNSIDF